MLVSFFGWSASGQKKQNANSNEFGIRMKEETGRNHIHGKDGTGQGLEGSEGKRRMYDLPRWDCQDRLLPTLTQNCISSSCNQKIHNSGASTTVLCKPQLLLATTDLQSTADRAIFVNPRHAVNLFRTSGKSYQSPASLSTSDLPADPHGRHC